VVLYMKGTPVFPQCGFSARVVQILSHMGVPFKGVNVLEDMEIREGIKAFTNWPTIPQLYVKGEFVGGCDIVTEMFQSGELKAACRSCLRCRRRASLARPRSHPPPADAARAPRPRLLRPEARRASRSPQERRSRR
jgi:monothiol glutaredoxin